jgi:predicted DNA-binding transcriptional regulator AlpA
MTEATEKPDTLVPDPEVWRELGVTSMTGWRYTRDPKLNFPPPIKIRNRNFRSRRMLEEFKRRLVQAALSERAAQRESVSA